MKIENIKRIGIAFSVIAGILLCFSCCVIWLFQNQKTETKGIYLEEQPPIYEDILCYDPVTGNIYSCFKRTDGNVQLRINPEGNRCVFSFVENCDDFVQEIISEEGATNDRQRD